MNRRIKRYSRYEKFQVSKYDWRVDTLTTFLKDDDKINTKVVTLYNNQNHIVMIVTQYVVSTYN